MSHDQKLLRTFRRVAIPEGVSFLVLLCLAMPLKYVLGIEWPVKVVGWAHGILFIAYCYYALRCWIAYRWSARFAALAFVASLLPFGPFVIDRRLPGVRSAAHQDPAAQPTPSVAGASAGR
jgi:integral membrane protein